MLHLSESQLDMLCELLPDHPDRPKGGRPRSDKRKVIGGIFWILDNGAKWKDLPKEFGSKSAVHRAFQRWVEMGAFEGLLAHVGSMGEERNVYEWYVDGTFSKAKGGWRRNWMHLGGQRSEDHDHGRRERIAHRREGAGVWGPAHIST